MPCWSVRRPPPFRSGLFGGGGDGAHSQTVRRLLCSVRAIYVLWPCPWHGVSDVFATVFYDYVFSGIVVIVLILAWVVDRIAPFFENGVL